MRCLWPLETTYSGGGFEWSWLAAGTGYRAVGASLAAILIATPLTRTPWPTRLPLAELREIGNDFSSILAATCPNLLLFVRSKSVICEAASSEMHLLGSLPAAESRW